MCSLKPFAEPVVKNILRGVLFFVAILVFLCLVNFALGCELRYVLGRSSHTLLTALLATFFFVSFSARSEGSFGDGCSLRPTSGSDRDVGDRCAACSYLAQIFCYCCIRSKLLGIVSSYVDHACYRILDLLLICLGAVPGTWFFCPSLVLDRSVGPFLRGLLVDASIRTFFGNSRRHLANQSSRSYGVFVCSGRRSYCPVDGNCIGFGGAFGAGGDAPSNTCCASPAPWFSPFGNDRCGGIFRGENAGEPYSGNF